MKLCCQLNGRICFMAECQKHLGCDLHFTGLSETLMGETWYSCVACRKLVDEIQEAAEIAASGVHGA